MSVIEVVSSKVPEVTKLRVKPYIYPYHPLPSKMDPVDYTEMMMTNIFGFIIGYTGQKSLYPQKGTLFEDPGYGLIRSANNYLSDGNGKNFRGIPL